MPPETLVATLVAVILLAGVAIVALRFAQVPRPWEIAVALGRAALQLAVLSLILAGVVREPVWVAVGLVVMFAAAVVTAAFRGGYRPRAVLPLAASMIAGPTVAGIIVFATGALTLEPRYLLALGGIAIGNTMTIAILTHRMLLTSIHEGWHEVEGWLALGATPPQSTALLRRAAIRTAMLPSVDQTRTTGIVVLPGAFVGAIFAGASPLEAGRFQLVVLAAILAAGALTSILVARITGNVRFRPAAATR